MAGWEQQQHFQTNTENADVCRLVSPPFWWMGPNPAQPVDDELCNAYETSGKFREVERVDLVNEMKLDDEGEYVPGEIVNNQKSPLEVGHGCAKMQWAPKSPDFFKPFDPESVPRSNNYLYSRVKRRQMMDLAATLREDSDYSINDSGQMCSNEEMPAAPPDPYGAVASAPVWPMSGHPVNEFGYNPATLTGCQRIIEAASSHIAGTNPFCFRDVIGRN